MYIVYELQCDSEYVMISRASRKGECVYLIPKNKNHSQNCIDKNSRNLLENWPPAMEWSRKCGKLNIVCFNL